MRKTLEGVFSRESVGKCLEEAKRYPMNICIIFLSSDLVSCIISVSSWNIWVTSVQSEFNISV